jgi:hypothetical protein
MKTTQFGKGFIYPLSLYAIHLRDMAVAESYVEFLIAVDGAYDHLRQLNIPKRLPESIKKDISYLINRLSKYKTFKIPFGKKVPKDRLRIINQSKKIFFDIDKYLNNNPIRGEYE